MKNNSNNERPIATGLNIVLYEPGIPQNTGNVARTCSAAGAKLHLIKPFGFQLSDKHMKRAGLDYWEHVELTTHLNWAAFEAQAKDRGKIWLFDTDGKINYFEAEFGPTDYLVFGNENTGLPGTLMQKHSDTSLYIPMLPERRSLNLATSAGIGLYEAIRQTDHAAKQ